MHDFGDVAPLAIAPVVSPRGSLPASDVGTQEPTMRHQFGFVMGLIITAAMAIDAITARVRGLERADTVVAHAVFVGIPAVAALLLYHWFPTRVLWVLLVPALISVLAGARGLYQFWVYAGGFAVVGVVGIWVVTAGDRDSRPPRGDHERYPR
ncbi:MAG TPA: hypothetical protein VD789_02935 [Thermomicrobiales bacterium]|nr:hypothetical protein [Thermomicrobiales bacterium]